LEVSSNGAFGSWSIVRLFDGRQMQAIHHFNCAPNPWRFGTGRFLRTPNYSLTFRGEFSCFSVICPQISSRYSFEEHIHPQRIIHLLSHSHETAGLASACVAPIEHQTRGFDVSDFVEISPEVFDGPDQSAVQSDMDLPSHIVYILLPYDNVGSANFFHGVGNSYNIRFSIGRNGTGTRIAGLLIQEEDGNIDFYLNALEVGHSSRPALISLIMNGSLRKYFHVISSH
jgi:hypothetical protein